MAVDNLLCSEMEQIAYLLSDKPELWGLYSYRHERGLKDALEQTKRFHPDRTEILRSLEQLVAGQKIEQQDARQLGQFYVSLLPR